MKTFIYVISMMILFSACSTSFLTSNSTNRKVNRCIASIPKVKVKSSKEERASTYNIPKKELSTIALLPTKQVGVSMPSYLDALNLLRPNLAVIPHTKINHSILASIIQKKIIKKIKRENLPADPDPVKEAAYQSRMTACSITATFCLISMFAFIITWALGLMEISGILAPAFFLSLLILVIVQPSKYERELHDNSLPNKEQPQKQVQNQPQNQQQYQDVVYLKNGSVIRGMIIEQIPDVSLKIQTADGSIFVYQMSDVDKITKELKQ